MSSRIDYTLPRLHHFANPAGRALIDDSRAMGSINEKITRKWMCERAECVKQKCDKEPVCGVGENRRRPSHAENFNNQSSLVPARMA